VWNFLGTSLADRLFFEGLARQELNFSRRSGGAAEALRPRPNRRRSFCGCSGVAAEARRARPDGGRASADATQRPDYRFKALPSRSWNHHGSCRIGAGLPQALRVGGRSSAGPTRPAQKLREPNPTFEASPPSAAEQRQRSSGPGPVRSELFRPAPHRFALSFTAQRNVRRAFPTWKAQPSG
jgi:hypothetical protein